MTSQNQHQVAWETISLGRALQICVLGIKKASDWLIQSNAQLLEGAFGGGNRGALASTGEIRRSNEDRPQENNSTQQMAVSTPHSSGSTPNQTSRNLTEIIKIVQDASTRLIDNEAKEYHDAIVGKIKQLEGEALKSTAELEERATLYGSLGKLYSLQNSLQRVTIKPAALRRLGLSSSEEEALTDAARAFANKKEFSKAAVLFEKAFDIYSRFGSAQSGTDDEKFTKAGKAVETLALQFGMLKQSKNRPLIEKISANAARLASDCESSTINQIKSLTSRVNELKSSCDTFIATRKNFISRGKVLEHNLIEGANSAVSSVFFGFVGGLLTWGTSALCAEIGPFLGVPLMATWGPVVMPVILGVGITFFALHRAYKDSYRPDFADNWVAETASHDAQVILAGLKTPEGKTSASIRTQGKSRVIESDGVEYPGQQFQNIVRRAGAGLILGVCLGIGFAIMASNPWLALYGGLYGAASGAGFSLISRIWGGGQDSFFKKPFVKRIVDHLEGVSGEVDATYMDTIIIALKAEYPNLSEDERKVLNQYMKSKYQTEITSKYYSLYLKQTTQTA